MIEYIEIEKGKWKKVSQVVVPSLAAKDDAAKVVCVETERGGRMHEKDGDRRLKWGRDSLNLTGGDNKHAFADSPRHLELARIRHLSPNLSHSSRSQTPTRAVGIPFQKITSSAPGPPRTPGDNFVPAPSPMIEGSKNNNEIAEPT